MQPSTNNSSSVKTKSCFFLIYNPDAITEANTAYILATLMNSVFIAPAIVLNILLLTSLYRSSAFRGKPSTLLLYSLAVSDLLLGLLVQPGYLAKKVGELTGNFDIYCRAGVLTYTIGYVSATASFLSLTVIAIDRYLLVTSGIYYSSRVTSSRLTLAIIVIWSFVASMSIVQFYIERSVAFKGVATVMALCVVITTSCYVTAVRKLQRQQLMVRSMGANSTSQYAANTAIYKKSTFTMLLVFVVFILCYTPYMATMLVASVVGESAEIWSAESIVTVIAYTNASLNPCILFWRMRGLRQAGKNYIVSWHQMTKPVDKQIPIPGRPFPVFNQTHKH